MTPPKKKIRISDECDRGQCQSTYDFSTLPYDVLIYIFKHLDFKTIAQCATLCQTFYNISNESVIYNKIAFKYNMDANLLENYISKARRPRHLSIQYKLFDKEMANEEDYSEFDSCIVRYINQCGSFLTSIHFESCRNDEVLSLITECPNLTAVTLMRCKGKFESLLTLRNLEKIHLHKCKFPRQILQEILQNNTQLKSISLSDNMNVIANEVCESLAQYNRHIEEVRIAEKPQARAKGIKALSRCPKLRTLELVGGPCHCEPQDSLQHLAAGCPLLERLALCGCKDINDETLMPILHSCTQLKSLDFRGINITIKSCREAALSLPFLRTLDVYKCSLIKKAEILKLQKEFSEIRINN